MAVEKEGTVGMGISFEQYLGLDNAHLVSLERHDGGSALIIEREALQAFKALQADAGRQGFTLEACSAYRSFDRQAKLFGAKFLGQRPILDRNEQVISDFIEDPIKRMQAILVFSALPGFSRHHFGSDLDIYAPNLLPEGQSLQLTYHEYLPGAYFYELGLYLKESLHLFDFANPYAVQGQEGKAKKAEKVEKENQAEISLKVESSSKDSKSTSRQKTTSKLDSKDKEKSSSPQVGYEPWHISHLPSARPYLEAYDVQVALEYVAQQDLPFAPWVKEVMSKEQIEAMLRFDIC